MGGSETKPIDSTSQKSIAGSDGGESSKEEEAKSNLSSRKKQGEDCDPSYMCSDEQHLFLACLRVPGDDGESPPLHLFFLLLQRDSGFETAFFVQMRLISLS